jgi:TolB-like protein/class 3 adenylate cyclase/AraC-like DNA-binding protein/Tfp pilus assembly protein PilF
MPSRKKHRRLAAIMFTDIVGYTAIMQQSEEAAAALRARHREVFEREHGLHSGEILQYFGDGTLSVFQSGVDAVECALAIQLALNKKPPVPLRIGLHLGDIVFDGTDIFGDGVNLASRIESLGVAGAILLSAKLNGELKNHPHISTQSLGFVELKNIAGPLEIFAVNNEGIALPQRSEMKGKQKAPGKSIAVLPFVNRSASEDNEYFCDGMTEEIINALTKIKNLQVTSRTSSFFFKNKNLPIQQVGRELKVSTVLEGSIRLAGKRMRITAQLVDVADDCHFWSETFDRPVEDVFAVQDEISLLIADKLREQFGHLDIGEHLVEAPQIPVNVYQRYLKSRFHLLKMGKADLDEGIAILAEIVREQPGYAYGQLGMHLAYTLLGTLGFMPAHEAFMKGQPYLDKAIELDPQLPECQLNQAYMAFLQDWDAAAAYHHINSALDIRPTVDGYQSMASILVAEGKFSAALHYIETALQIDPLSPINCHLRGFIDYCQGRFGEAIEWFVKGVELKPDFKVSTLYWGQALICLDRKEDALAYFKNLPDDAGDILKLGGTTLAQAALGQEEMAQLGIEQLEAHLQSGLTERALNLLILCQAMLGREETALDLIAQGILYRLPMLVYLPVEPLLKPLHPNPRFQELMRQVLGEQTPFDVSERKYKKTLFTKDELEQNKLQLAQLMAEQQPYLDPNLTLRDLASLLGLPPNQLSQLLNEGFDKNFAEFVNTYRLAAFKSKAADPALQHLTILGLAYESGFNSKTVFNTFFKKTMGMTPKAYWKEKLR